MNAQENIEKKELVEIPIEIERRWILRQPTKHVAAADKIYYIYQKYSDNGWRYRRQAEIESGDFYEKPKDVRWFKTKKTVISKGKNSEEEYEISENEFENNCGKSLKEISKIRYVYFRNKLKFEVDVFHTVHLVILELELNELEEVFEMPKFLKDQILFEVTGIKEFNNSTLAANI